MNIHAKRPMFFLLSILILLSGFSMNLMASQEISYSAGERRDPFTPLIGPDGLLNFNQGKVNTSEFPIEGIILDSAGDSVVIIGEDVYRKGDTVKGAQIIEIYRDRILLVQEDEEKTIWLREESKKDEA